MKKVTLQYAKISNTKVYFESLLTGFLISLCLIVVCVFGFFTTHSLLQISGHSMEPGIASEGQSCFVYNNASYTYGDIIVAHKNQTTDVIKRVIAMEGDKVGFKLNTNPQEQGFDTPYYQVVLIKSGQTTPTYLNETYLYAGITDKAEQNQKLCNNSITRTKFLNLANLELTNVDVEQIYMLTIKENYVFYLGDNRAVSEDCSSYGAMPTKNIQGRVDQVFDSTTPPIWVAIKAIFGFNY